ncbi:amidohydrolase family protein [Winogradskyella sp.]|uniref:amidohydrolase family protein n=1 Tax=Winogradskyella sp. TaxID=1883156 RepID=UPI00260B13E0|nr:amidohydrolase family protein [Winogradskyella sp.]
MKKYSLKGYIAYAVAIFILVITNSCSTLNKNESTNSAYILYNANIVNVKDGTISKSDAIVIDKGTIKHIGSAIDLKKSFAKNNQYNLSGRYVIPGLWDMHVHVDKLSRDYEHSERMLSLFTLNGVTSIREMGGDYEKISRLKSATKTNSLLPSLYNAGPIFENKKWLDRLALDDPELASERIGIADPSRVSGVLDSILKLDIDFIKIRTAASDSVFFELADQCKKKGIKLCGHIDGKVDLYEAVKSGINSIEHVDIFQLKEKDMTDSKMDSIVSLMEDLKTGYCPTLLVFKTLRIYSLKKAHEFLQDSTDSKFPMRAYASQRLIEKSDQSVGWAVSAKKVVPWEDWEVSFLRFADKIVKSNVPILAGTDGSNALILPGFSLLTELEMYQNELHMTPLHVLQSATMNAANFFELSHKTGYIKEGYDADLVILEKNPLENIKNLRSIYNVIKSGKIIDQNERKKRLKKVRDYNINNRL